jgi:hypothetical protein
VWAAFLFGTLQQVQLQLNWELKTTCRVLSALTAARGGLNTEIVVVHS